MLFLTIFLSYTGLSPFTAATMPDCCAFVLTVLKQWLLEAPGMHIRLLRTFLVQHGWAMASAAG